MNLDTEVPRSFVTHASLFNTLSSNKLSKNSENPGDYRGRWDTIYNVRAHLAIEYNPQL